MAIFDRAGAAKRVGRDARTLRRWEEKGWLTFTLGRVREAELLAAEKTARENRGGDRRGKGQKPVEITNLDESAWPDGAVADGWVYSLEITRCMKFEEGHEDLWVPSEPDIIEPPFEVETMTGTYLDVSRRAAHLNMKIGLSGIKAFIFYPSPIEPQGVN